jgi:hypothetical protein
MLVDWIQDLSNSVRYEVGALSAEDLAWRPDAEANNIGVTVWHMARWLDVITVQVLSNKPADQELWHTRGWAKKTGYDPRGIGYKGLGVVMGYTQAEVKAIPILSADELLAYFDQTCAALCDHLRHATPPGALHQPPLPESGRQRTAYQSLKPILQGCFGHVGEIEALKAMQARSQGRQP